MGKWSGNNYKIIFTGPVGAGKTTAINALSDIPVVSTEKKATDETRLMKNNTTVAMDYGILRVPDGGVVHLYGTPGQDRFDFMWEVLTEGGLGLIIVINDNCASPLDDLEYYLEAFKDFIGKTALAVGINNIRADIKAPLARYHDFFGERNLTIPLFAIDARKKRDVQILTLALLNTLDVE